MSTITEPLIVSTTNPQNSYYYDSNFCDNKNFTDYPSPVSSPDSPMLSEDTELKSNNYSYCDYCASPCSITSDDDDVDIVIDLNTPSERSYTNNNTYTNINNSLQQNNSCISTKNKRKRSFSEVEDNVFCNIDNMSEEELDSYFDSIDLDLFPKVKSSSELLIFSPLAMKRFKLSN